MKIPDDEKLRISKLTPKDSSFCPKVFSCRLDFSQWLFQLPGFEVIEVTKSQSDHMVGEIGLEIYSNLWLQGMLFVKPCRKIYR